MMKNDKISDSGKVQMDASISSATGEKLTMDNADNSQLPKGDARSLPKGWEMKKLGEVCEVITKGTTPTSIGYKFVPEGINFIKVESIDLNGNFIPEKFAHITNEGNIALKRSQLKKNDILFSIAGALGRTAIVDDTVLPANTNQALSIIRIKKNPDILREYVLLSLSSGYIIEQIEKSKGGVAQQNLSLTQISNFKISLPPLPEQKRIVAILDKAFNAIDKAKANAEQNLQNAKELFESYLNRIFEKKGDDWEEKPLKELSKINYGYTEKAKFENIGPKFLRITDIQNNNVNWETVPYCKCSADDLPKYKLENGDIVFARTGATTGKSYLIENPPISVFASYLIRLKLIDKDKFVAKFIMYFFNSNLYWDKINSGISGSAQGGFNATKLGNLNLTYPKSIKIQKQIIQKLDTLQAETKKLEAIYQKKIEDLEELKKSVLQKAFKGEL